MMEPNSRLLEYYSQEAQKLEAAYSRLQQQFCELKENLEASHQTLQQIVNHISEGLIFVKKNGIIALFNPAAATLTNLSTSLARQGTYWNHFPDHFFGFSMKEMLTQVTTHHRIFLTLEHDIDVEVSTSSVPDKGIVLMLSNHTEQQKLQKSLNQAERLKELGEMAATLAHEIRNPLGGIEGFAQLLKRDLEGTNHLRMIHAILDGTQTLNNLVASVLDYARPMRLHFAPTDLIEIIQEAIALMGASDKAFNCKLITHFPTYKISIDRARIKLVLLNLLRNASESGANKISIEVTSEGIVMIKDNGSGMSSRHLEKIFTPFFTTKSRGNGLGLAASLAVVKAHGGTLEVLSEEGKGSQFNLKLIS